MHGHQLGLFYQGGGAKKYCLLVNGVKFDEMPHLIAKAPGLKHNWDDNDKVKSSTWPLVVKANTGTVICRHNAETS